MSIIIEKQNDVGKAVGKAVDKVKHFLNYGDKEKYRRNLQREAPFGVSNEAEASDASGDEAEASDASGDEVPKESFAFKHPLDANNDSSVPDKVISFEGVNTAETAKALLLLYYPKCKYHIILNLKLMFSIQYLIYNLKFVHMVLLVMNDKQFNLVTKPIKTTHEILAELDSTWEALVPKKTKKLYRSFNESYNVASLIPQQREDVCSLFAILFLNRLSFLI